MRSSLIDTHTNTRNRVLYLSHSLFQARIFSSFSQKRRDFLEIAIGIWNVAAAAAAAAATYQLIWLFAASSIYFSLSRTFFLLF